MTTRNFRTAFIHGRPQGHPIHALYAKSINAVFSFEDRFLRWQDRPEATKLRRYTSWVINAIFFPKRRDYDVFFTECIRIPQLLMKCFGLLRGKKLIALMADESLYFLKVKRYPVYTERIMTYFLRKCDAIICIGDLETSLAKEVLPPHHRNKILTIYNAVPRARRETLRSATYNPKSTTLLFIGHASTEWRSWYKGLDLMVESFAIAAQKNIHLKFLVVGEIGDTIKHRLCKDLAPSVAQRIEFVGPTDNLVDLIQESALYFHCSRGDAYPTTVLEAMCAGLIPLISEHTGVNELVGAIDQSLIAPLDSSIISERILDFLTLSEELKLSYSQQCRNLTDAWSEEQSIEQFKETFRRAVAHGTHE